MKVFTRVAQKERRSVAWSVRGDRCDGGHFARIIEGTHKGERCDDERPFRDDQSGQQFHSLGRSTLWLAPKILPFNHARS